MGHTEKGCYEMIITRQDWLLLALSKSPGGIMSPVQIQKTLFLFGQEVGDMLGTAFYSFEPYDYGPFDAAIYDDLRRMMKEGHVREVWCPGRRRKNYLITKRGQEAALGLDGDADARLTEFLGRIVEWVKGRSFSDLLRSVYAAYPEFAVNSVFRGK